MNSDFKQASEARYVLAFDTANEVISLAVGRLDAAAQSVELVAARQVEAHRASNTQLLPNVDSLLEECGVARQQLACIACGRGPGSFTGVRICIATAKGIASALEVPLVGVSTLDALAWELQAAGVRGRTLVVADAMRQEVYPQVYNITEGTIGRTSADIVVKAELFEEEGIPLGGPSAARPAGSCAAGPHCIEQNASRLEEVSVSKPPSGTPSSSNQSFVLIAGDALAKYADIFEAIGPLAPETQWRVQGPGLLAALQAAWHAGECDPFDAVRHDPAILLPVYTRLSDAEEHEREKLAATAPRDLRTGVNGEKNASFATCRSAVLPNSGSVDASVPPSGTLGPPCSTARHEGRSLRQSGLSYSQGETLLASLGEPRISYRPFAAADIDQAVALETVCMGTDAWNTAQFADELGRKDRSWWVALDEQGALVGYAGGQVLDGQLQLFKIATAPEVRRAGIAHELLVRLAEDARNLGAATITLEVRAGNKDAQAFYEALGLASIGSRPGYYSDGEDATIYQGPLLASSADIAGMKLVSGQVSEGALGIQLEGASAVRPTGSCASAPHCIEQNASRLEEVSVSKSSNWTPTTPLSTYRKPLILAIESSCDETAAAVVDGSGAILADTVASQIDFHARFGGVVPEIASRKHIEAICGVAQVCLEQAGVAHYADLDAIACTYAPGLVGALVVGVAFAKGAAWGANIPYIQVNHLEGHLYANKLVRPDIAPPMVASLVSGGHTMLVHVKDWGNYEILGSTIDDAVGEAFDKVAKALGLGYPGGPVISRYAAQGNSTAVDFPRAMLHSHDLRFSLSGLKTAVVTYIAQEQQAGRDLNIADIAASFQAAVIDVQIAKARTALEQTGAKEFCLGGGVAANPALRAAYETLCAEMDVRLTLPPASACTDNAAMIACVALDRFAQGKFAPLSADAFAHTNLEEDY